MKGGLVAVLVFAAVLVAPGIMAAQATIDLRSELPVTLEGQHAATTDDGAFLLQGDDGQTTFLLQSQQGTIERVLHRIYGYISPSEPQLGLLWEQRVEREELPLTDAYLGLEQRTDDFTLFVHDAPLSLERGAYQTPLHVGALDEGLRIQTEAEQPIRIMVGGYESAPFEYTLRPGLYQVQSQGGRLTADGAFGLYLAEGQVTYRGPDETRILQAGYREEEHPGAVYDPVTGNWRGAGTHTEYVYEHLELQVTHGLLQVQYGALPGTLFTESPTVSGDGTAFFPAATGTVNVEDETTTVHTIDGEDLLLTGRYQIDMTGVDWTHTKTDAQGGCDCIQVKYGQIDQAYDWSALAAAGFGALLLGLVAWISGVGKWVVGSVGGLVTGYARVQGEDILEHPGRLEVYERIKADPGMHFMDLGEKVDFGPSTLNYHLRVLERNGYVTRVKDGRYVRFFDRKDGEYSQERKHAASTLRNDQTAAIASHIIQNPGVAQRDLAQCFGIAPSTVSWHIARLQKEGLVQKQRDHHFTRYYMGDAWSSLPAAELARVGLVA